MDTIADNVAISCCTEQSSPYLLEASIKDCSTSELKAYKNRTQFMFGGEPQKISFNYYGPSVEAVLDKFPMAKVVDEKEGVCSIEAEVFGTGVKMWLLSQGSKVKVTAPETLEQEIKQEIGRMDAQYEQMGGKTNG